MALSFIERELWAMEVLHYGNKDFFYFLRRYIGCAYMNFLRQGFRKLSFDTHTYITGSAVALHCCKAVRKSITILEINTNLINILHRFQVMADYWSNFRKQKESALLYSATSLA